MVFIICCIPLACITCMTLLPSQGHYRLPDVRGLCRPTPTPLVCGTFSARTVAAAQAPSAPSLIPTLTSGSNKSIISSNKSTSSKSTSSSNKSLHHSSVKQPSNVGSNGKTLMVVESPTKAFKIQKFLGDDFKVNWQLWRLQDVTPPPCSSSLLLTTDLLSSTL